MKHGKLYEKKMRLIKRLSNVYNKNTKNFLLISNSRSLSLNTV